MTIVRKTLDLIHNGRSGNINSIPTGIPKFDQFIRGTKQRTYYLYGAETTVGKTAFVRDKHIHTVYEHFKRINDPSKLDVQFVDFSLEISPEISMAAAFTRKLFFDYGRVVPVQDILENLSDENLRLIEGMEEYFDGFEKKLIVHDEDTTPDVYHDILMDVAKKNGTFEKEGRYISECTNYTPNNPALYVIIVVDTVNLVDSDNDAVIKRLIDRISRISVWFRNKCGFTPIIIQQFNAEISAVDRSRYGIKTPLLRDFEDSKRPVKDADVVVGLYDPSRHMRDDETFFKGYDIGTLRTWFRSAHIMKNRRGENNKFIPMKFDGAVGFFEQLPPAVEMTEDLYARAISH